MKEYCLPEIPSTYLLRVLKYECRNCKKAFQFDFSSDGDGVIKFESQVSRKAKWLPVYGNGGYLDLFKKLGPTYTGALTPKIAGEFVRELNKHVEKETVDDVIQLSVTKHQCPYCQSKDLKVISENILTNPDLDWLKISCELFTDS